MKWLIIFGAGLTLAAPSVRAQEPDTAQLMVHYKFSHLRDTTNRTNPYRENMVLIVGKTASVYRSYDRQLQDALFKKQYQEQLASSGGGPVRINRKYTGSTTEYFQYPNKNKMWRKESLFGSYLVDDTLSPIQWQVMSDTASFAGLHCQKAIGHFKGRDYIAWFCPDLPLRVGPWKLNGLPGVIVDAHDVTGDIQFTFDGVEEVTQAPKKDDQAGEQVAGNHNRTADMFMGDEDSDPGIIKLPENAVKTTDAEFNHLKETARKDPDAFARMLNAQNAGGPGQTGPRRQISIKIGPQPVNNNPIELPEKQ